MYTDVRELTPWSLLTQVHQALQPKLELGDDLFRLGFQEPKSNKLHQGNKGEINFALVKP